MTLKHLPRHIALWAIRGYQRYISPYKGFSCAWRIHTGRCGCSAIGYRAIRRYGVLTGLAVLNQRLYLCGVAYRRFTVRKPPSRKLYYQRGNCGIPDADCDMLSDACDMMGEAVECASECFSWSDKRDSRKKSGKTDENEVHIPPPRDIGW